MALKALFIGIDRYSSPRIDELNCARRDAVALVRDRNISSRRTSRYQLKIGSRVSFYPNKGTIFVDGEEGARPNTGLGALEEVLREHGYIRRDTNAHTTKLPSPTQPALSAELLDAPDPD